MVIIPFERAIDWKRPPVITFLLVLINAFVFFSIQRDDDAATEAALEFYFQSTLPELEFPAYLQELEARRDPALTHWRNAGKEEEVQLLMAMQSDGSFASRLRANLIITPENERFAQWRAARDEFERRFHRSTVWSYGFVPSEHRPVTFLTHMFLHGSTGHLIGNMIFLVLVGLAVELALGSVVYLLFYLLGGLGAVGLFALVYATSTTPLVGASGAIAAVMGLYAVLYGARRIRFFYSLLFYFDFIKAPAYIMLFLWIGNEFYQLYGGGASNVAYMAHIGGLITGALLGFAAKSQPKWINLQFLDAGAEQEQRQREFEKGLRLITQLQMDEAVRVFKALHQRLPQDVEILAQYYKAARFRAGSGDHHQAALMLLGRSQELAPAQAHETFCDYMATTQNRVRIPASQLLSLAHRFAKAGYAETAERILAALIKRKPDLPGLGDALTALAETWHRRGDEARHASCLAMARRVQQIPSLQRGAVESGFSRSSTRWR